jgi:hypothetical protein
MGVIYLVPHPGRMGEDQRIPLSQQLAVQPVQPRLPLHFGGNLYPDDVVPASAQLNMKLHRAGVCPDCQDAERISLGPWSELTTATRPWYRPT